MVGALATVLPAEQKKRRQRLQSMSGGGRYAVADRSQGVRNRRLLCCRLASNPPKTEPPPKPKMGDRRSRHDDPHRCPPRLFVAAAVAAAGVW